jgi:hydrogenase maturation protein HypF
VLLGDYAGVERIAWLRPAPLPGGDAASREPWRCALARLDGAGLAAEAERMFADRPLAAIRHAMAQGINAPLSSSAGRLFDAFAALTGFQGAQSFEGEAAMALEALSLDAAPAEAEPLAYALGLAQGGGALDDTDLWGAWQRDRAKGTPTSVMALRFHVGLAQSFARQAHALVAAGRAGAVVLSGGCFQNALLLDLTIRALDGVRVLHHRTTPANDGGLALGQALVAAARR